MTIQRIAIIFDNTARPETTGVYCLRALDEFAHVEFFLPSDLDRIPRTGFDLYLNIDDGLRYYLPCDLRPSAWWAIDTHIDPAWAEEKGRRFDWLFAAQRDGAERLAKAGLPAHWLPLACDPAIHRPHPLPKRWDVCFVGRVAAGLRHELLQQIQQRFPNSFIGQCYFDDFGRAYSQSRIGFNRSVKNDLNMRVFETLGCGALLVTNDLRENGQEKLFQADRHLVTYRGADDLLDKLRFYLGHDEAREKIAQAGHAEVTARHTYRHRMQAILQAVDPACRAGAQAQNVLPIQGPAGIEVGACRAGLQSQNLLPTPGPARQAGPTMLDSIDFIIKTFLRPQALLRLLRSILEFYPQANVTIADDGDLRDAPDADSRACCELIDGNGRIALHSMPFGAGVTPGRNLLVEKTNRPFLLLLDDDFCFTAETKIERLWDRLTADQSIPPLRKGGSGGVGLRDDGALGLVAGACIDVIQNERRPRKSGGTLEIQGATLVIDTAGWRDRAGGLRDYVPQFALVRREVFETVRWEGAIGGEHYDFCLQLQKSPWKVAQDMTVVVDHHHFTAALPGYVERRHDCAGGQQWLLRKWNLARIVQDGEVIGEREASAECGVRNAELSLAVEGVEGVEESKGGMTNDEARTALTPTLSQGERERRGERPKDEIRMSKEIRNSKSEFRNASDAASTLRTPHLAKDFSYFEHARPEVVALIPATARHVLDIGCGAGRLGELLKQRQAAEVVGIERQSEAAALARQRLNQVIELSAEDEGLDFPEGRFDCIVCADVLEHLREPAQVLARIRRWLTPDGALVASLPNVRHHTVVASLLEGNWTYESAGLLDSDHVRFFTRREIEKLLYRQGFDVLALHAKPGPGYDEWHEAGRPGSVRVGSLNIAGLAPEDAEEFFTYQYLVVARPKGMRSAECGLRNGESTKGSADPAKASSNVVGHKAAANGSGSTNIPNSAFHIPNSARPGLTSIIIVTHNQLAYTKECIDSIRLRTDEPYELIFVDNGSTDGTSGYLRNVAGTLSVPSAHGTTLLAGTSGPQNTRLIENPDNRGFPAAVNQALPVARGEFAVLLNNDMARSKSSATVILTQNDD